MVSPYPPPGTKHVYGSGVASYTKNLVVALRNIKPNIEIHIIADRREDLPRLYVDNNIIIHRVYTRNPLYVFQIFKELNRIKPNIVHIQHEYFLYGGVIAAAFFPLLVVLSKLVSKKVIVTIHGVVPLKLLDDDEFRRENGIHGPVSILKIGLLLITKLITIFSTKIIVHELFLKEYLARDYKVEPSKIVVIPHGVEDPKSLPKDEAKKKLGLEGKTVLLYFGYLTGYKGIKELLSAYKDIAKNIPNTVLIVAGGPHPRLAREKWYIDWLLGITKRALDIQQVIGNNGKIIFTGYVPEEKIPLYFSAADIIVLPYKGRIAASGPEALAIAFEKCYILFPILDDKINNIIYSYIKKLILINVAMKECISNTLRLKRKRLWINISEEYYNLYES